MNSVAHKIYTNEIVSGIFSNYMILLLPKITFYRASLKTLPCFYIFRWIEGFLGKEAAEKKLKDCSCNKSGFFLLRFSDWNIRRSQGKDAVYGYIATTVSVHCK